MMKRSVLAVTALLFSQAVLASGPVDSTKTPEQVADLYLAAFIGSNADKAKELNDYLRPEYKGQDALNVAAIAGLPNTIAGQLKSSIMQAEPHNDPSVDAAAEALAKAAVGTLHRSSCHATGSTIAPNEAIEGKFIATVSYECRVPDVTLQMKRTGLDKTKAKGKETPSSFLNKLTALINSTPADSSVKDVFTLYSSFDKKHWYTENPAEPIGVLMNSIMGDALQ